MKYLAIVVSLCVFAGDALADTTCTARAAEKKLAGAALASFMKKCQEDAAAAWRVTSCRSQENSRTLRKSRPLCIIRAFLLTICQRCLSTSRRYRAWLLSLPRLSRGRPAAATLPVRPGDPQGVEVSPGPDNPDTGPLAILLRRGIRAMVSSGIPRHPAASTVIRVVGQFPGEDVPALPAQSATS